LANAMFATQHEAIRPYAIKTTSASQAALIVLDPNLAVDDFVSPSAANLANPTFMALQTLAWRFAMAEFLIKHDLSAVVDFGPSGGDSHHSIGEDVMARNGASVACENSSVVLPPHPPRVAAARACSI